MATDLPDVLERLAAQSNRYGGEMTWRAFGDMLTTVVAELRAEATEHAKPITFPVWPVSAEATTECDPMCMCEKCRSRRAAAAYRAAFDSPPLRAEAAPTIGGNNEHDKTCPYVREPQAPPTLGATGVHSTRDNGGGYIVEMPQAPPTLASRLSAAASRRTIAAGARWFGSADENVDYQDADLLREAARLDDAARAVCEHMREPVKDLAWISKMHTLVDGLARVQRGES